MLLQGSDPARPIATPEAIQKSNRPNTAQVTRPARGGLYGGTQEYSFVAVDQDESRMPAVRATTGKPWSAPPCRVVERQYRGQQRLDLLDAAGFRRMRAEKLRRPSALTGIDHFLP